MLCSLPQLSSGHKKHPEVSILSASIKICVKQLSKRAFLFNHPIKKLMYHPGDMGAAWQRHLGSPLQNSNN